MNKIDTNAAAAAARSKVIARGNASGTDCYVASAKGALLTDMDGRTFIDFAGGIAVMNVGHFHPKVVDAVRQQAGAFMHTCFMVSPYASAVRLTYPSRFTPRVAGIPGDKYKLHDFPVQLQRRGAFLPRQVPLSPLIRSRVQTKPHRLTRFINIPFKCFCIPGYRSGMPSSESFLHDYDIVA